MTRPRSLRPANEPLGSYLRVGRLDHKFLVQMLVEGRSVGTGLVADACLAGRQGDVCQQALDAGLEVVFDPRSIDLSTPGGFARSSVRDLPWAGDAAHQPVDLHSTGGTRMVKAIVEAALASGCTAVLAPTHLLESHQDPWLGVDEELTRGLRQELNARGLKHVLIYYPLAVRAAVVHHHAAVFASRLARLPIDSLWLRVHPFGTTSSGPRALAKYLHMCRELHNAGVPLVAEHTGTVGVALLAFGAVGGIESGVTIAESTSFDRYTRLPSGTPFAAPPRVYLHELGAFVKRAEAEQLFAKHGMKAAHGCTDARCCPRGWRSTLDRPREHFVAQRAREVAGLTRAPEQMRAGYYMERFLRPASDRALRAEKALPALASTRSRLESWRGTLGADLAQNPSPSISQPAAGRGIRHRRSA